jgi:uroporphyrinogen III methyltransferase/synthase
MVQPLFKQLNGLRVVITRSANQAQAFAELLSAAGAVPLLFPAIHLKAMDPKPLEEAAAGIDQYDWLIFTSGNAVEFFFDMTAGAFVDLKGMRIAAIGSATATALAERGLTPDFIPDEYIGEALVHGLGEMDGKRVLLPRSRLGRPEIVTMLNNNGALVDDIPIYDTITGHPTPEQWLDLAEGYEVITFTSPSSVRNFQRIWEEQRPDVLALPDPGACVILCIGPITAESARDASWPNPIVAAEYTIEGMLQALMDMHQDPSSPTEDIGRGA